MTRVLVLGLAPLPFENQNKMYGPGIRTWQFVKPLLQDGHEICLVASRIPFAYPEDEPSVRKTVRDGVTIHTVAQDVFETTAFVQQMYDAFKPDCVVGATIFPSFVAAGLRTEKPLWVDLFGHVMAEAQAKAHVYGSDQYLYHFWNYERRCLLRGDMFSAVSQPQKYATIGELGAYGRLNRHTFGLDLVHSIPCAIEGEPSQHRKAVFRGTDVDPDDFVILWSGGYNTWTDVDTLMAGLERAMRSNPRIKFVSTGGQIDGHDELTYPRFLRMIERSPFARNFVMRGWVPSEDVANYYFEADVAINVDSENYEAILGSRNRILSWLASGLPVLTTNTTELSQVVHDEGLGYIFPHHEHEALGDLLLRLSNTRDELRATGRKGKEYVLTHYTFESSTGPLRSWVTEPRPAPDRGRRVPLENAGSPNGLAMVPSELRQYYATAGLRGVMGRTRSFVVKRLRIPFAGAGLDPTHYLAHFADYDVPAQMQPGERRRVWVKVINHSARLWPCPDSSPHAVNLSYHWYKDGNPTAVGEGPRCSLPHDVAPGQGVDLEIDVTAPNTPGDYTLSLEMLEEGVAWFRDVVAGSALNTTVSVDR